MLTLVMMAGLNLQQPAALWEVDPPTDREVLQALPPGPVSIPLVRRVSRGEVTVVKNRLAGQEARLFGVPVPVLTSHWECVAYYRETARGVLPIPFEVSADRAEVVYLDKTDVVK